MSSKLRSAINEIIKELKIALPKRASFIVHTHSLDESIQARSWRLERQSPYRAPNNRNDTG